MHKKCQAMVSPCNSPVAWQHLGHKWYNQGIIIKYMTYKIKPHLFTELGSALNQNIQTYSTKKADTKLSTFWGTDQLRRGWDVVGTVIN